MSEPEQVEESPEEVVVRRAKLATVLAKRLRAEPSRTVPELAEALEVSHDDVVAVLHSYSPKGEYVGEGQGGPWVEPPVEAEEA